MSNGPLNDEMRQELSGEINTGRNPLRGRQGSVADNFVDFFQRMTQPPPMRGEESGVASLGEPPPLSLPELAQQNNFGTPPPVTPPNPPGQIPNIGDPFITPGFRIPGSEVRREFGIRGLL